MRPKEQESFGGFKETLKRHSDPSADIEDNREGHIEAELDHGVKETFPASDPVSIVPNAD